MCSLLFFFFASVACGLWHLLSKNNFMMDFLLFPFIQTHQDEKSGSREESCNAKTNICLLAAEVSLRLGDRERERKRDAINWTLLEESGYVSKECCIDQEVSLHLISIW